MKERGVSSVTVSSVTVSSVTVSSVTGCEKQLEKTVRLCLCAGKCVHTTSLFPPPSSVYLPLTLPIAFVIHTELKLRVSDQQLLQIGYEGGFHFKPFLTKNAFHSLSSWLRAIFVD